MRSGLWFSRANEGCATPASSVAAGEAWGSRLLHGGWLSLVLSHPSPEKRRMGHPFGWGRERYLQISAVVNFTNGSMLVSEKEMASVSPPSTVKVCVVSEQLDPLLLVVTLHCMVVATEFLNTAMVTVSAPGAK